MAAKPNVYDIDERSLERLRNDPEVVVRRQRRPIPFTPAIRVVGEVDLAELIGRDSDDQDDQDDDRRAR